MGGSEGRAGPNRGCPKVPPAVRMSAGATRCTGSAEGCKAWSTSALARWWAVGVSRDDVTGTKGFLASLKTLQAGGALNAAKRCLGKVSEASCPGVNSCTSQSWHKVGQMGVNPLFLVWLGVNQEEGVPGDSLDGLVSLAPSRQQPPLIPAVVSVGSCQQH